MFRLIENQFLENGKCRYEDEYGNRAFFEKTKDGFDGRILFVDKRVKLAPLSVTFPLKDLSGTNLDIEYRDGVDKEEAFIKNGLNGFIELVQRWIRMHGDIRYMGADTKMLMKCAGSTDEVGVCQTKMRAVAKYEELQPAIDAVFSGSGR